MVLRFFKLLFGFKITWIVTALIAGFNIIFLAVFQPPLFLILLLLILDLISFTVWGVLTANSDYFSTHSNGSLERIDINAFNKILKETSPEFKSITNQCIKLIGTITREFKQKMKLDELDYLVDNINMLASNNRSLYQRFLQFGTKEQKDMMKSRIDQQVKSMSSTYEMLQAFSGNLSLLDANNNEVSDASTKLKYINQSLQDLVKGTE
jgi:hypothetical protein